MALLVVSEIPYTAELFHALTNVQVGNCDWFALVGAHSGAWAGGLSMGLHDSRAAGQVMLMDGAMVNIRNEGLEGGENGQGS